MVDIGTNSMRLLITGPAGEAGRWVEVTGLGRGVDETGLLSDAAMERTLEVLARYGLAMDEAGVGNRAAMATSATRDASNREEFLSKATDALGVRPEVVPGEREGALAFAGATSDLGATPYLVSDIGGGSTEFVTSTRATSVDIGSVRLTDRLLTERPATEDAVAKAIGQVSEMFAHVPTLGAAELVGVAGTWTSLAAIDLDLPVYDREKVHHHRMSHSGLRAIVDSLTHMSVAETAAIPSLDPARAPVILSGAVVALCVLEAVGAGSSLVSERDSLDGLASELLALA